LVETRSNEIKEKRTASGVTGDPSAKASPSFRITVYLKPSSLTLTVLAKLAELSMEFVPAWRSKRRSQLFMMTG
jgi:hypothetical protein